MFWAGIVDIISSLDPLKVDNGVKINLKNYTTFLKTNSFLGVAPSLAVSE